VPAGEHGFEPGSGLAFASLEIACTGHANGKVD
jgi:hypothetical protein